MSNLDYNRHEQPGLLAFWLFVNTACWFQSYATEGKGGVLVVGTVGSRDGQSVFLIQRYHLLAIQLWARYLISKYLSSHLSTGGDNNACLGMDLGIK